MEKAAALKILQQLADGTDPHTGKAFGADSPYQHPDTVRALFVALRALDAPAAAPAAGKQRPPPPRARRPIPASRGRTMKTRRSPPRSMPASKSSSSRPRTSVRASRSKCGSPSSARSSSPPICADAKSRRTRQRIRPSIKSTSGRKRGRGTHTCETRVRFIMLWAPGKGSFPPVSCSFV